MIHHIVLLLLGVDRHGLRILLLHLGSFLLLFLLLDLKLLPELLDLRVPLRYVLLLQHFLLD